MKTIILAVCLSLLTLGKVGLAEEKSASELDGLRSDIQILNLLNSLNLSTSQMEYISLKAKEAQGIKESVKGAIENSRPFQEEVCRRIKNQVETGKVRIEDETAQSFRRNKHASEAVVKEAYVKINGLASDVEQCLQEYQLVALDGYKACIIPVMQDGRIGQADKGKGIVKVLESVRAMPLEKFSRKKEDVAGRVTERLKEKLPPQADFNEAEVRAALLAAFGQVRAMDDADFLAQKSALAEEITGDILSSKPQVKREDKIKRFLFSERAIPIYEKKLQKM